VLGGLLLALAAGGALWWRAQPAAPTPTPAPTAAPAPAPELAPQEAFVPAPQPVAPPPAAATTIVLGDDASPVAVDVEAEWDGKMARGLQDADLVLKRAVDGLGGPEAVEAHRRFTAHISVETPFMLRGKLLFDVSRGAILQLDDVPSQLYWSAKDGCHVLYGPRRVVQPCTSQQTALTSLLWDNTNIWAGQWSGLGKPRAAGAAISDGVLGNGLQFGTLEARSDPLRVVVFSAAGGELIKTELSGAEGLGTTTRFARLTSFDHGWRASSEWRVSVPVVAPAAPPMGNSPGQVSAPAAGPNDFLMIIRRVELGVDPSAFTLPKVDALQAGLGTVRVEADRTSSGILLAPPGLSADAQQDDPNSEWMSQYIWHFALGENVAVVDDTGKVAVAVWFPSTDGLPKSILQHPLPLPRHVGWITARAEVAEPPALAALAQRLLGGGEELGQKGYGSVYFRSAIDRKVGDKLVYSGELQVAYPAPASP